MKSVLFLSSGESSGFWFTLNSASHPVSFSACFRSAAVSGAVLASVGTADRLMRGNASAGLTAAALRGPAATSAVTVRSEEHTSELQSLMRISYAVFCLKQNIQNNTENALRDEKK